MVVRIYVSWPNAYRLLHLVRQAALFKKGKAMNELKLMESLNGKIMNLKKQLKTQKSRSHAYIGHLLEENRLIRRIVEAYENKSMETPREAELRIALAKTHLDDFEKRPIPDMGKFSV